MDDQVLLSICIPTYNRCDLLRENLIRLVRQVDEVLESKVEILVSNNSSTDETDKMVKALICDGKQIIYNKNKENLGPDKNFLKCIDLARGEYVWILGDDDYLKDGAIKKVISILQNNQLGLLHIQTGDQNNDLICNVYNSQEDFLKDVSFWLTYISGNIFNKKYIRGFKHDYTGTFLAFLPYYIQASYYADCNMILTPGILDTNHDGKTNIKYGVFDVFANKFNYILKDMNEYGINDSVIQRINNDMLNIFFPLNLIKIKRANEYEKESIDVLKNIYNSNVRFWLIDYIIYILPRRFAFIYWKILKSFIKIPS